MVDLTTPTIQGRVVSLSKELRILHTPPSEVILNNKFLVKETNPIPNDFNSFINCWGIGNGGHKVPAPGASRPSPVIHSPKQAALYNHIPFVVKPVDNDLSETDIAKYRFRVKQTINGNDYYLYYLKKIPTITSGISEEELTVNSGTVSSNAFTPNSIDRDNPTPITLPDNIATNVSNKYLTSYVNIPLTLTTSEITDIKNGLTILYGSGNEVPVISEIALCNGWDLPFQGSHNVSGTLVTFNYTESVGTIVSYFLNTFYMLDAVTSDITINVNIGQNEPMLIP